MRKSCDLRVLIGHAVARVDHDHANVRPFNGKLGTHDREFLHPFIHLGSAADAGRVNKDVLALVVFKGRVDGVACRSRHVADDHALLAQDTVDK